MLLKSAFAVLYVMELLAQEVHGGPYSEMFYPGCFCLGFREKKAKNFFLNQGLNTIMIFDKA